MFSLSCEVGASIPWTRCLRSGWLVIWVYSLITITRLASIGCLFFPFNSWRTIFLDETFACLTCRRLLKPNPLLSERFKRLTSMFNAFRVWIYIGQREDKWARVQYRLAEYWSFMLAWIQLCMMERASFCTVSYLLLSSHKAL